MGLAAGAAGAEEGLTVPINTVVRTEPGVETVLASMPIDASLVGAKCDVTIDAHNQESVHPGNDLVVRSGESSALLANVEGQSGADTGTSAQLVLGESLSVSLIMGSDGVFSGGFDLTFDCGPGGTGSETSVPVSTTAAETTSTTGAETTTTTEPADTTTTTAADTTTTTEVTSTTAAGDVSGEGQTNPGGELARTGTDTNNWLGVLAGSLITLGAVLWGVSVRLAETKRFS
ncbi:MAG: hypothetical protein R2770_18905 [Acidimicrobiales bacterium]